MVLQALGRKLTAALSNLNAASTVDEGTVDAVLKELATALLEADVNVKLVGQLRTKVKARVMPLLESKASSNIKGSLQRAIVDELVALVDPSESSAPGITSNTVWRPKKKTANVIMFVGLQGAGKTTSCTKLAVHYQKRGFKSCLVCADTFRAGAFDQLKQNAAKAKIPFYGSYTETDPAVISAQGVEKFRKERFEVIIVDTSGRHRQETELFDEMKQISAAVRPDLTVMVLDGAIGQAAESQSKAFKEAAGFGAIIVTKMDGHARGGGAISAVAATKTPIMFIGVGEHLADLERFEPRPFISKLLGMGDIGGLMERVKDAGLDDKQDREKMIKKLVEGGVYTLRDMRDTITKMSQLGPMSKLASMIPGLGQMSQGMGASDEDQSAHFRKMICISDAMTPAELDSDGRMFEDPAPAEDTARSHPHMPREPNARVLRVARGSGTSVDMVEQFLIQHRLYGSMAKRMGGAAQMTQAMTGAGGAGGRRGQPDMAQLQSMLPAQYRTPEGFRKFQAMAAAAKGDPMKLQNMMRA